MERNFQNPSVSFVMEVIDLINETFVERKEAAGCFGDHDEMLEASFLRGNCYQYAMMLHLLFPDSKLGKGKLGPKDERVTRTVLEEPKSANHVVAFIKVAETSDYVAFDVKGLLGTLQEDYEPYESFESYAFADVDMLTGDSDKQKETQEIVHEVLRKVKEKETAKTKQ